MSQQIIDRALKRLTQKNLLELKGVISSGEVRIPPEIDRILLFSGKEVRGRLLTEGEKRELRSEFKKKIKSARIEDSEEYKSDSFEFEGGGYKVKSSGSGNLLAATLIGGALVLVTVAAFR